MSGWLLNADSMAQTADELSESRMTLDLAIFSAAARYVSTEAESSFEPMVRPNSRSDQRLRMTANSEMPPRPQLPDASEALVNEVPNATASSRGAVSHHERANHFAPSGAKTESQKCSRSWRVSLTKKQLDGASGPDGGWSDVYKPDMNAGAQRDSIAGVASSSLLSTSVLLT